MKNQIKQCLACGSKSVERGTRETSYDYKDQVYTYAQAGVWCNDCGEVFLEKSDLDATDLLIYDFMARVDGRLTSADIRRVRKKLELTQKQAGELIGGGPNAFSRYERGKAYPTRGTENFLRVLDKHPELLQELLESRAA